MRLFAFGLSLLLASTAASAQSIESALGDWSDVPTIEPRGATRISNLSLDRLHELAAQEVCEVPGFHRRQIDLSVPVLIQFTPENTVERVIIRKLGCDQLETLVGGVVLELARAGEYRPTGENQERWYRSEFSFVSR
jgi:hypothetical protein